MSERKLMKAFQILEFGKPLVWRDVEKPIPGSYEVLVRSRVTGICHTDLHIADGDLGNVDLPLTPGHEGVGVVECVGSKVTNFAPGDRIGVPWLGETCQSCTFCTKGYSNVCPKQRQTGFLRQGTCAEYFLADSRCSVLIPQNIADNEAAPVLCAGLTAYKAIKISGAVAGNLVVIAGSCGGLGHLAVQYAKAMGLSVIALDLMDDRKRLTMKALGADYVVDVKNMNEELEKIKENITQAIIFAPVVGAVTSAINYIAPGGTVVCVGLSKENFSIPVVPFILKELRLQGSIVGTKDDLVEALEYVANGSVQVHTVSKHVSCLNDVLHDIKLGKVSGRVVVYFE